MNNRLTRSKVRPFAANKFRVLFYEPNPTGHHFAYLARMLPGFLRTGADIILETSATALKSKEWEISIQPFQDQIEVRSNCRAPGGKPILNAWKRARELRRLVKQVDPHHVCVCYADGIWQILAGLSYFSGHVFPKNIFVEGWVYRGGFAYPNENRWPHRIKRRLFMRLAKQGIFSTIHIDDELLFQFALEDIGAKSRTEFKLTPNPIQLFDHISNEQARATFGLNDNDVVISSSGMISQAKGIDLLIDAFVTLVRQGEFSRPVKLLLVGPHAQAIHDQLDRAPANSLVETGAIVSVDRFVDEEMMYACAAASDLVVACYPKHSGRSSIILWAAAAGRPVVATAWGCIGYVVETQNLGITCNVLSNPELSGALAQGISMNWNDTDQARVRQYAETHSIENYQRVASGQVARRIRERRQGATAT